MTHRDDRRNRAVSPVIGVVLLVAIAVIAMAVLGTQVLGSGVIGSEPRAELVFDEDPTTNELTIGVRTASGLEGSETEVRVPERGQDVDWGESGEIESGNTVTYNRFDLSDPNEGDTIQVISSSTLIDEHELRNDLN